MNKKILKLIIIIIAIIIIMVFAIGIRNFIVVNQILKKNLQYENASNYYYKINLISQNSTITEMYRKENIYIVKNKRNRIWTNVETNEIIVTDYSTNSSQILEEDTTEYAFPTPFNRESALSEKLQLAIHLKMKTEEISGKKCYVIEDKKQHEVLYIEKDTGLLAKVKNNTIEAEYIDWKINSLTDADVERPNV